MRSQNRRNGNERISFDLAAMKRVSYIMFCSSKICLIISSLDAISSHLKVF